jgi:hypothetical protein
LSGQFDSLGSAAGNVLAAQVPYMGGVEDMEMTTASNSRVLRTIPILLIVLLFCPFTYGKIIYVDDDAAGANDGTSWTKAYLCLQDALAIARSGDEIHVAKGIYKPDQHVVTVRSPHAVASGDRTATFQLKNGLTVKGGYAGAGEPDPDARDINLNQTILSGDLNGDDGPNFTNNSENSYHVATGSGTNETAVLDGFTITAGNANGFSPHNSGAGMYNDRGSPTVTNCAFSGNSGVNGGGMYNSGGSSTLTNCIFNNNLVSNMGGGIFNYGFNNECNLTLINCTFSGNSALNGGGMLNGKQGNAILTNCTFMRNHGYGIICDNSQVTVVNTILWNDSPFEIAGDSITVSYSDVRGGWSGIGNIDSDPLFMDADGADDVSGTEDDDLRLLPGSPCIDAGDNSAIPQTVITDLDGNPRIVNETVDMGAYEAYVAPIAHIYYVDAAAPGDNDGSSWSNAFLCLQGALAVAQYGDEIRVAKGLYRPDQRAMLRRDLWQIVSSGDWTATFQLINGVTIKGGYAGFSEVNPDARNIERYKSVLSGDLNGDDGAGFSNIWDNSYQVVTAGGTQWTTMLDGFTITGGNADGPSPYDHGGGIYNVEGSPTLIDCTITGNSTTGNGGGMHNSFHSDPTLVNCTFSSNMADYGGGISNDNSNPALLNCILTANSADGGGGGMCNYRSNPILANCRFIENSSVGGGGMFNEESEPMLSDCTFNRNSSTGSGGGIFNENGNPVLLSCILSENSAPRRSGGGMYNRSNSQPSLSNCIFAGNSAINGGAMDNIHTSVPTLLNCTLCVNVATQSEGGGISNFQDARPILVNCILCNNSDRSGMGATAQISGSAQVSYSCIQNSTSINPWPGQGNINTDPCFVDLENGDYHLKSQAGRWDSTNQSWVIDQTSSPCIDAGDPGDPVGPERFPNGGRINMGAYGGTPEASLSPRQPLPVRGQASNPSPPDRAVDVNINVVLSWSAGFEGALHKVYLGIDFEHVSPSNFDSMLVSQQTNTTYDPGLLDYNQTYYWRVDEVDNQGMITTGEVWSFTTVPPPRYPKGRSCFTSETNVWMNGALMPISKVSTGQSFCLTNCFGKIREVQEHNGTFTCYDVLLESGNCLSVAENHYFLDESGQWISLQNLKKGTKLKTAKGTVGIINITKRPMPYIGKVYNLKVDGSDRYLVGKDAIIARDY